MNHSNEIAEKIKAADAILIGAANGLSITEGLHLFADNAAFENVFGDLKRKYGIRGILQGMTARWTLETEKWGFWSRLAHHYCSSYTATQVMQDLKAIVGDKDYFIITTNGECHFEMSGFAQEKTYEVEGNWFTMQCAKPCHDVIYPCSEQMEQMANAEEDGKIPEELVPRCPKCGGPMQIHMDGGSYFIPDITAKQRFQKFLDKYHEKKLVVLELGIGPRNQLIKVPLMNLVYREQNATYVTINLNEIFIPREIQSKSYGLDGSLDEILAQLRIACEE
jgi:NAD-dependent SIR2 family protein deacetylase